MDDVSDVVQPGQGVLQILFCARCSFYSFITVCSASFSCVLKYQNEQNERDFIFYIEDKTVDFLISAFFLSFPVCYLFLVTKDLLA